MKHIIALLGCWFTIQAHAATVVAFDSIAETPMGIVTFSDSPFGLLITPKLTGLTPGIHGFHIHQHPDCSDNAMASGGHYDPTQSGQHLGPYNPKGHLGDLPPLFVNADGSATTPTLAPRLKERDLQGRAFIIHAGGDNFSDQPQKLGGGGARVACAKLGISGTAQVLKSVE